MHGAFQFLWRQFHNISFSVKDEKRFCGVISVLCYGSPPACYVYPATVYHFNCKLVSVA